jgi:hypothetical protein
MSACVRAEVLLVPQNLHGWHAILMLIGMEAYFCVYMYVCVWHLRDKACEHSFFVPHEQCAASHERQLETRNHLFISCQSEIVS